MNNDSHDFDTWFDTLVVNVLDRTSVEFKDRDSVQGDYDNGRDVFDVIDEIAAEYGEAD